jgi:hypothetical protein
MKICPVEADTDSLDARADRQTTKLTVAFCNFVNSLKICIFGRLRSLSDGSPLRITYVYVSAYFNQSIFLHRNILVHNSLIFS